MLAIVRRLEMVPDLFKSLYAYLRFRLANFLSRNSANKPIVIVHLDRQFPDIPDRRYFYLVLRTLVESGYYLQIVRKMSFRDFRGLRHYEKYFLQLKDDMRIVSECPRPVESSILITNVASHLSQTAWQKVAQLDCDVLSGRRDDSDLFMPYFMHPMQYQYDARDQLDELRMSARRVKIFFSGNVLEADYLNPLPGNKLTRAEIVRALQSMPGVEYLNDERHFREILSGSGFTNACVINDRRVYAVPDEEWLPTLARGDFFLCLPGSRMPLCHNAIEAMSVGAVPILNYSEWFEPPLEDGKNCIEFATLQELRDRLTEILSFDSGVVEAMRQRVVEYYEENLSPLGFRNQLERSPDLRIRLIANTAYPWETELIEGSEASLNSRVSGDTWVTSTMS